MDVRLKVKIISTLASPTDLPWRSGWRRILNELRRARDYELIIAEPNYLEILVFFDCLQKAKVSRDTLVDIGNSLVSECIVTLEVARWTRAERPMVARYGSLTSTSSHYIAFNYLGDDDE